MRPTLVRSGRQIAEALLAHHTAPTPTLHCAACRTPLAPWSPKVNCQTCQAAMCCWTCYDEHVCAEKQKEPCPF